MLCNLPHMRRGNRGSVSVSEMYVAAFQNNFDQFQGKVFFTEGFPSTQVAVPLLRLW